MTDETSGGPESRREFLKRSLALATAASVSGASRLLGQVVPEGAARPLANEPPHLSLVVHVASERVLPVRVIQPALLKDCLVQGLCALTGKADVRDAWHALLQPDDVILVKFNQAGAVLLGTSEAMAAELVQSLTAAGWAPEQLILLEVDRSPSALRKTRLGDTRWQGAEVRFATCGQDAFIAALDQATAIVNVPFLKTHHLATMTGCLKNLSHGLIRHPSRFHGGGCDPAIGEIVASDPIRSKLRLNITNALRVVFDRGPDAREDQTHPCGTLLLSTDPVACDAVGHGLLNEVRSLHNLGPLLPQARLPRSLATAVRLGLGRADAELIDVRRLEF